LLHVRLLLRKRTLLDSGWPCLQGAGQAERKARQSRDTVSPDCRARYLEMLVTADFVDDVRGLETPYLVIVGDKDPGLDAEAMAPTFLAWHPNAELLVIPNCGHYPMQECPPYFATVIEGFLKRSTT
ncbi:alpha/beta fold hydrolase, partial [Burkholderia vietnamiensis]